MQPSSPRPRSGVDGANTVARRGVRADEGLVESRDYRLVVQSFDAGAGTRPRLRRSAGRLVPAFRRRPPELPARASTSASSSFRKTATGAKSEGAVVAWIEAGKPDLEFDGRTARPRPGSMVGLARRASGASPGADSPHAQGRRVDLPALQGA